jgi:hypothetical protein
MPESVYSIDDVIDGAVHVCSSSTVRVFRDASLIRTKIKGKKTPDCDLAHLMVMLTKIHCSIKVVLNEKKIKITVEQRL